MKIYISFKKESVIKTDTATIGDVARVYCENKKLEKKVKQLQICHSKSKENTKKHEDNITVMDVTEIIEIAGHALSDEETDYILLGEPAVLIRFEEKKSENQTFKVIKIVLICILTAVGAAYGIMAYNNDVGTIELFQKMYDLFGAESLKASHMIEVFYAIGLFVGIVIFYDHFAGKKISKSPTPIEVEMDKYDSDICESLIEKELNK